MPSSSGTREAPDAVRPGDLGRLHPLQGIRASKIPLSGWWFARICGARWYKRSKDDRRARVTRRDGWGTMPFMSPSPLGDPPPIPGPPVGRVLGTADATPL